MSPAQHAKNAMADCSRVAVALEGFTTMQSLNDADERAKRAIESIRQARQAIKERQKEMRHIERMSAKDRAKIEESRSRRAQLDPFHIPPPPEAGAVAVPEQARAA